MKRWIKLPLMLLFALLQCMTPFAHAHVDGHSEDSHVHVAFDAADWLQDHPLASKQISADTTHSAVVGMQPEHRIKELVIVLPVFATSKIFSVFIVQCEPLFSIADYQPHPLPPFQHPNSQAPPV
ncbi:MAG: hypothetical protein ACOH1I_00250 [Gallionellaceae bacterium]|jgi:hypothetical protein